MLGFNQGGLTLKDLKPDIFEGNEKSKLSFRQRSDEFSSSVERSDRDFETMLRSAAQMHEWDKFMYVETDGHHSKKSKKGGAKGSVALLKESTRPSLQLQRSRT